MILTGKQIKRAKENGWLDISDWDEKRLNPNSYNLRLADELAIYDFYKQPLKDVETLEMMYNLIDHQVQLNKVLCLDMKENIPLRKFKIPEEGYVLLPGILYLGRTMEYTKTHKFVPMLEGRSSVGRLGIQIHSTAGFGDVGFCGYWTLEISCVQPVRIYPGVEICQIYYHTIADSSMISCPRDEVNHYGDIYIPPDCTLMKYDNGKYQKNDGIQGSMMWKEFQNE